MADHPTPEPLERPFQPSALCAQLVRGYLEDSDYDEAVLEYQHGPFYRLRLRIFGENAWITVEDLGVERGHDFGFYQVLWHERPRMRGCN